MNTNGTLSRHWLQVSFHFVVDAIIFALAFFAGLSLRFDDEWRMLESVVPTYWSGILIGATVFPCVAYTFGLYSPQTSTGNIFKRSVMLGLCLAVAMSVMVASFYVNFSSKIGRGAMLIGSLITYFAILIHHGLLLRSLQSYRERVLFIVSSAADEAEIRLNRSLWSRRLELVGQVPTPGYRPTGDVPVLGSIRDLHKIVNRMEVGSILCSHSSMSDPTLYPTFCQLRYSGVSVVPLISFCEDIYQYVPLDLVTTEWLLNASGLPHMLYIKKLKRGFDIASSLVVLFLLSPCLLAGMALVKLTSPGPIFYRQVRCGRFGRSFTMLKLRTMRVDAEKDGAVWAKEKDPRATPVGGFLRKYRVDEIPQLINVLGGEMSLVGPRPERPEFVEELAAQVPFYKERLMIQPGITGWAQVNYPYGASVEDAGRKLEYDLYYMKHMSIFLDLFILLDTVRTILSGGLSRAHKEAAPRYQTSSGRFTTNGVEVASTASVPRSGTI
ncbi:MAG: exopolysaccharide biosynthesis polyprenyl glycosylphosphotransferase [Verrucomicrobiota bacterium]